MKYQKRLLSILLGTILLTGLTACGSDSAQNTQEKNKESTSETVQNSDSDEKSETAKDDSGEQKKLVFWDKSEYVASYNELMKKKVDEFAKKNNVEVEYVVVPAADMKQKLMAAIEAKNVPDLIVGDDTLVGQFVSMNQIADCSDIMSTVEFTDSAKVLGTFLGKEYLVPLAFTAPGMYWRKDIWEAKGLTEPKTWEELKEQAKKVNDPANGFYALGFPMGASGGGDAEGFCRTVILDYGGVPVDENGAVTINSPETLEAMKYIASLFEEGLVPPDAITWDDSANNSAYLAGTVGIVCNSGSIISSMKEENPDLLQKTQIIGYAAGPDGKSFALGGANVFGVFATGKNTESAKEFVKFYFEDKENYNTMIEAMGAMWQPVVNGMDDTDFWKDPTNAGWLANSQNTVKTYYPAPSDEKATVTFTNQLCVKAMQEIIVNGAKPQEALDNLETAFKAVYEG